MTLFRPFSKLKEEKVVENTTFSFETKLLLLFFDKILTTFGIDNYIFMWYNKIPKGGKYTHEKNIRGQG
jgi:hypothetical protein